MLLPRRIDELDITSDPLGSDPVQYLGGDLEGAQTLRRGGDFERFACHVYETFLVRIYPKIQPYQG